MGNPFKAVVFERFYKIIHRKNTIEEALIDIMNTIPASYCILIISGTDLYILKDRYGIRPLSYGYKDGNEYLSSETVALSNCSDITEVGSGEILKLNQSGIQSIYNHPKSMDCICLFEIIYFMNPSSYIFNCQNFSPMIKLVDNN